MYEKLKKIDHDLFFKKFCILAPILLALFGMCVYIGKWGNAFTPDAGSFGRFIIMQTGLIYRYGVIPRGLLNTVLVYVNDTFFNGQNYLEVQLAFRYISIVIFNVFSFVFIYKFGRKLREKYGTVVYPLIYIALFFCFRFFEVTFDYATYDIYLIAFLAIALYFVCKDKPFLAIIPMTLMMFFHEGSLFMNMPIIYAFALLKTMGLASKSQKIKYWVFILVSGVIMSGLFVYFSMICWRGHTFLEYEDYIEYLINLYGVRDMNYGFEYILHDDFIKQEFIGSHLAGFDIAFYNNPEVFVVYCYVTTILYMLLFTPFVLYFRPAFRKLKPNDTCKLDKIKRYLILIAQPLALAPFIVFKTDEGRWFRFIVFYYIILIFYKIYNDDCSEFIETVKERFESLCVKAFSNVQSFVCYLAYVVFLYPHGINSPSYFVQYLVVLSYYQLGR